MPCRSPLSTGRLLTLLAFFAAALVTACASPAAAAADDASVPVMDHAFYRVVTFPGFEAWNAVWDLHASGSEVYIALCAEGDNARSAQLIRYEVGTGAWRRVLDPDVAAGIDLDTGVMPQSKFHTAIRTLADGRLVMVSHNTAAGRYQPEWHLDNFRHDPTGFSSRLFIYDPKTDQAQYLGVPLPHEDFYYGALDPELNVYYLCAYSTRTLYRLDLRKRRIEPCDGQPCTIAIVVGSDHAVYTADQKMRIWKWDPMRRASTLTALRMPHSPLLPESDGTWVYGWRDPDGWIYAVPQYCNRICRFRPHDGAMQDLGSGGPEDPANPGAVRVFSPVRAGNGKIYYGLLDEHGANPRDGAEIIELDPETGARRNLGTMRAGDGTLACVLGEGALGADGKIYWGDGNHGRRGAVMWIFDPSKIPADYRPTERAARNPRDEALHRHADRNPPVTPRPGVWRFTPEPGAFHDVPLETEYRYRATRIARVPLTSAALPAGDNAVMALGSDGHGGVYGLSGCVHPVLFHSPPGAPIERLAPIATGSPLRHGSLLAVVGDEVYAAADQLWCWAAGKLRQLAPLPEGERLAAIAAAPRSPYLYALSEPGNVLHVLERATGTWVRHVPIGGYLASRWLAPAQDGGVWLFGNNARIYHATADGTLVPLAARLPASRGLEYVCEVTSASTAADGTLWGGTREGYLFAVAADGQQVRNLGRPGAYYLKGVTPTAHGIYCFSGGNFGDTHCFRFEEADGFTDLGVVTHRLIDAVIADDNGGLCLGEYADDAALLRFTPAPAR